MSQPDCCDRDDAQSTPSTPSNPVEPLDVLVKDLPSKDGIHVDLDYCLESTSYNQALFLANASNGGNTTPPSPERIRRHLDVVAKILTDTPVNELVPSKWIREASPSEEIYRHNYLVLAKEIADLVIKMDACLQEMHDLCTKNAK